MGGFGVIATQLTDRSARPFTLTVGGVDVLGLNGSSYKTEMRDIEVIETGPNGVSSLHFRIWDPAKAINPTEMAEVEFWDTTQELPLFTGFVQSWNLTTRGIGRWVEVECIGVEAILDWMIMPTTFTAPQNGKLFVALLATVGQALGVGVQLRALCEAPDEVTNTECSQEFPVGTCGLGGLNPGTIAEAVTITEGMSLREALVALASKATLSTWPDALVLPAYVTVDFYHGLRIFNSNPTDYDALSVVDEVIGLPEPAAVNLDYTTDAAGVVRQVYVKGSNAAGSGLIADGTGITGPTAFLEDDTSNTGTKRDYIGQSYLATFATAVRGTVDVGPWQPSGLNVRAGAQVLLYDASLGLSAAAAYIFSITKRFHPSNPVRQSWSVAFGGDNPSAIRQLRRLTRSTRS